MIGIIVAMPDERDAVLEIMHVKNERNIHGVKLFEGTINEIECVLAVSGLGKVKAAKCTELMILVYGFDKNPKSKIINIGTSGCLNPKLNIGDIVIAKRCIQFDLDLTVLKKPDGRNFTKGESFEDADKYVYADEDFVNLCKEIITQITQEEKIDFNVIIGTVATGDQFINDPTWKLNAHHEFDADCDEMEGAAIAKVCSDANVSFGIIRSVSDKPKDAKICDYETFKHLASSRCAKFLDKYTMILSKTDMK